MNPAKYQAHVDGLRCISVALVIAFHFQVATFTGGYVGVDVFFAISGYLIIGSIVVLHEAGSFNVLEFWQRRIRRLLPAILMVLILVIFTAIVLFNPADLSNLGKQSIFAVFSLINFSLLQEVDYFDQEQSSDPLLHFWSLAVEEQFYVVFPLIVVIVGCLRWNFRRLMLIALAVLSISSTLLAEWLLRHGHTSFAYYMMPTRFAQLAIGGVLAIFTISSFGQRARARCPTSVHNAVTLIGLVAIVIAALRLDNESKFPGLTALVPTLGACLVLFSGQFGALNYLLTNRVAVYLGQLSFSLYLIHWPVWVFWTYYLDRELMGGEKLAALLVTFALSMALHHLFEKPVRFAPLFSGSKMYKAILPLLLFTLLGGIGTWYSDGWPQRVDEHRRDLLADAGQFHTIHFGGRKYKSGAIHVLGDKQATPSLLLIGDSKARQFASGLDKILLAQKQSIVMLAHDGCPFVLGAIRVRRGVQMKTCLEASERAIELAGTHGTLPIIFAKSWSNRLYVEDLIDFEGEKIPTSGYLAADQARLSVEYLMAVKNTGSTSRMIYLLGSNDGFHNAQPAANCVSRPDWVGLPCLQQQQFDAGSYTPSTTEKLLENELIGEEHFRLVPMTKIFCDDMICSQVANDGTILFSDKSHLSTWGAEVAGRRLLEVIGL